MRTESFNVLGSRIHLLSLADCISKLERWIEASDCEPKQVVVTGFHGIWEAYKDKEFKKILAEAELWVPDGIAPVLVARLKGHRSAKRLPGAELMHAFFHLANQHGYRSFFYGDTNDTLAALETNLNRQWPSHIVAGTFSPPFRPLTREEDEAVVSRINSARPHVLWVALGLPRQERWIYQHRHRLQVPVVIGVGAAFGFLSGRVKRCPEPLGNLGLEWAYRFLMEPRKLWRRDLLDGPRFLCHVLAELSGLRKYD